MVGSAIGCNGAGYNSRYQQNRGTLSEQTSADETAIATLANAGLTGTVMQSDENAVPAYVDPNQASMDVDAAMASPQLAKMMARADLDIVTWVGEKVGDKVYGTVIDIRPVEPDETAGSNANGENRFGPYNLIVIQAPSGTLRGFHAFHTSVKKNVEAKIANGELRKGSLIVVSYRGEGQRQKGKNPPRLFNIEIAPPA